MKNKQIVASWNRVEMDIDTDIKMLHAILARKRAYDKKQERRDMVLICLVQIMLFAMALSIGAIVMLFSPGLAGILLMGYVAHGVLIAVIMMLSTKNRMKGVNGHD